MTILLPSASRKEALGLLYHFLRLTLFSKVLPPQVKQITEHFQHLTQFRGEINITTKLETFPVIERTMITITIDKVGDNVRSKADG